MCEKNTKPPNLGDSPFYMKGLLILLGGLGGGGGGGRGRSGRVTLGLSSLFNTLRGPLKSSLLLSLPLVSMGNIDVSGSVRGLPVGEGGEVVKSTSLYCLCN